MLLLASLPGPRSQAAITAAGTSQSRHLKDCLLPAPKHGGFARDSYILWCSSVVQVGDTYHLFASRWPAACGLAGWTKYDDGTCETFARRERPFVYTNDKDQVIALFTAYLPTNGPARVVVQPVKNYYPEN